jgi:hypothetical protein
VGNEAGGHIPESKNGFFNNHFKMINRKIVCINKLEFSTSKLHTFLHRKIYKTSPHNQIRKSINVLH